MATKPTTTLHWADDPTTLRTEPSEPTKNTGFSVNGKLPAQFFNWIAGICGDWITWLDERIDDAYFYPTKGSDCRIYGDPDEGIRIKDSAGNYLPVMCKAPVNDSAYMAVTVGYLSECICNFIAFEHDYGGSPLAVNNMTKTYVPLSDYTPTVTGQGITINGSQLDLDETGIYHISVALQWASGPASPYARSLIVNVGTTEHTSFLMNEVSGNVARTQQYSFDVEITNISTQYLKFSGYQASGSTDYIKAFNIDVHQVGKRLT